jgi:bifunctional pyridoxal-dependent enzyme with beta-cystathionase and maltose regulon repressor activities
MLNSTCNPTGSVISIDDLHKFEEVVWDKELFIISNEANEDFVLQRKMKILIKAAELIAAGDI